MIEVLLEVLPMNFADLFKKNIIFIPVVASIVVGSFTGIKYVLNLTTTINQSEQQIVNLEKDLSIAQDKITEMNTRLSSLKLLGRWQRIYIDN